VDLVFSPSYSLPLRLPAPGVVTVHDLSFERLPEDLGWRERWRRRVLARLACRRAARVLADREGIRRELVEGYGLAPGDVGVVPLGVDSTLLATGARAAPDDSRTLAELGVAPPYLLHLGALLDRRRPEVLLEAFARLRHRFPDLSLVLAGPDRLRRPGGLARLLADPRLASGVVRLGWVPEAAVGPLYRGAELTLYLSTYGGFGLPPLESLASGTPAVVSPGQALDDLWPGYPYRCQDFEPGEVAETIAAALADPAGRAAVAAEGRRRAAGWSWRRAAEVFLAELERAAGR
jgi:glycosyltransferase involved in cell wall biosynthesis